MQNRYGVGFGRVNDDLLAVCGAQGIAFVPFFAIAGERCEAGADLSAQHAAVTDVAARHRATPAQVRLAWTLHRGRHMLAIPGTGDPGTWWRTSRPRRSGWPRRTWAALDGV